MTNLNTYLNFIFPLMSIVRKKRYERFITSGDIAEKRNLQFNGLRLI